MWWLISVIAVIAILYITIFRNSGTLCENFNCPYRDYCMRCRMRMGCGGCPLCIANRSRCRNMDKPYCILSNNCIDCGLDGDSANRQLKYVCKTDEDKNYRCGWERLV